MRGLKMFSERGLLVASMVCCLMLVATSVQAQVVLPDTGVDIADAVAATVTLIGTGVAAIIAAFFAFKAVKLLLRWCGRIAG